MRRITSPRSRRSGRPHSGQWPVAPSGLADGIHLRRRRRRRGTDARHRSPHPGPPAFAHFFGIDPASIAAAAERPASGMRKVLPARANTIVAALPENEKNAFLVRVLNDDPGVSSDLRATVQASTAPARSAPSLRPRTVRELLNAADRHRCKPQRHRPRAQIPC